MSTKQEPSQAEPTRAPQVPGARTGVAAYARHRLQENPYPALKNITCDCDGAVLVLRGRLPSYFLKQMAQAVVGPIEGVRIVNRIEVERRPR